MSVTATQAGSAESQPTGRHRDSRKQGSASAGALKPDLAENNQGAISPGATDDEILGLDTGGLRSREEEPDSDLKHRESADSQAQKNTETATQSKPQNGNLQEILRANPELQRAWDDAHAYRESFATPEEARTATAALGDLDRMDALFFSGRGEDHAELARAVATLDPDAFRSFAQAVGQVAAEKEAGVIAPPNGPADPTAKLTTAASLSQKGKYVEKSGLAPTQEAFFHSTNEAAVRTVIDAIESQVQRLLPEGISKAAQNRLVGEIYRELDVTLRSNRQLAQQTREAFRSGALDDAHRAAIVSLIAGRARQALPAVAKRVLNEWTSTIVAANHDRRARQRTAERRVDIAGSGRPGTDGRRSLSKQDIDYSRMSDADILNL